MSKNAPGNITATSLSACDNPAFDALEKSVSVALEHYSNVHRGSGHCSLVTTFLYDEARKIVLDFMQLDPGEYLVIFCTARREQALVSRLLPGTFSVLSSSRFNLELGVRALAVKKNALPPGNPPETGGGTTRLISGEWVIYDNAPDKFEAGTPAVINIIAFARALQVIQKYGPDCFNTVTELPVNDILKKSEFADHSRRELLNLLRNSSGGRDLSVPTVIGNRKFVNLDHAASTPAFKPVTDVVYRTWRNPGNINSTVIPEVRTICSNLCGAPLDTYEIIFTSNTTEAINIVSESFVNESSVGEEPVFLTTMLEHTSNDLPWRNIPGSSLIRLSIDENGLLDIQELEKLLHEYNLQFLYGNKRIRLLAITGASNVLGVCNDLETISAVVHRYGARIMVDAAQLIAHRSINMQLLEADYLAFSGHKAYAPFGTGVLIAKKGSLSFNEAQLEKIRSSGEENPAGIAALGKALLLLQQVGFDLIREEEKMLTQVALDKLAEIPGLTVYGIKDSKDSVFEKKGGVIVFILKGLMSDQIAKELAAYGIGIRFGCHCAHNLVKHILGVGTFLAGFQRIIVTLFPRLKLPGVARISFGIGNTGSDVEHFIGILSKIASNPRDLKRKTFAPVMDRYVKEVASRVYGPLF